MSMAEINKAISKIRTGTITQIKKLNKERALAFEKTAISDTRRGRLGLTPNTSATQKIQKRKHHPEFNTGDLLNNMELKFDGQSAKIGYFANSSKRPKGSKVSYSRIAVMQHTGYRIPLFGEKGENTRKFLAAHGIFPRKTTKYLIVVARPFLPNSVTVQESKSVDAKVIRKYMDKLWGSL